MPNATPSPDPSRSAHPGSALFEEYYDRLMAIARQRMEIEWRSHRLEHLQYLRSDLLELHREFGALLRVVFRYGLAEALREEFRWFASVLANRKSPHDALALLLDSWIVAIQGLVRPPECNLLAAPLKGLREALPSLLSETPRPSGSDAPVKAIIGKLITGDLAGARAILSGRLAAGIPPHDLVPALLLAAMSEIGSRWEQDSLQIFEEHLATETTARLLAELPAMASPVQRIGRKALVSGVPDDHIQIVPLALAVYLELRGWTALSLGHGLPAGQIAAAIETLRPDAVFLSLSMVARIPGALETLQLLDRAPHRPPVITGGRGALLAKELLESSGARVTDSFDQAHRLAGAEGVGHA